MDAVNEPENTPAEKTLLTITEALDAAGAPRTDTERDGFGINLELGFVARIRWLVEQLDAKEREREKEAREASKRAGEARQLRSDIEQTSSALAAHGVPMDDLMVYQGATWLGRELTAQHQRADENAAAIGDLERKLIEVLGQRDAFMRQRDEALSKAEDLSKRYNRATDELQAHAEERDKVLKEHVEHAEGWRLQCGTNERTIARLITKIKRLKSAGSDVRFALTSEPLEALLKADIVVDAKSGKVVKNRLGTAQGAKRVAGSVKPARAKTKTKTRKRS